MSGEYTTYDFEETMNRAGIDLGDIDRVAAAWGTSPEGWGSWEGAFIVALKDGRWAHVWGWCDTSGWGCQDGYEIAWSDADPGRVVKRGQPTDFMGLLDTLSGGPSPSRWEQEWDEDPIDLNRLLVASPGAS